MTIEPIKVPEGSKTSGQETTGYFVMINYEQSAGSYPTLEEARTEGQRMCDAEAIPAKWSIADEDGNTIETIERTDSRSLSDQVATFNKLHLK